MGYPGVGRDFDQKYEIFFSKDWERMFDDVVERLER